MATDQRPDSGQIDAAAIGHALGAVSAAALTGTPEDPAAARARVIRALIEAADGISAHDMAATLDLHPNTVRNHLDVLVAQGCAHAISERSGERGRPRTLYSPVPERLTPLHVLDQALGNAHVSASPGEVAAAAATTWLAANHARPTEATGDQAVSDAVDALEQLGFEAASDAVGDHIEVTECPYTPLIATRPEICTIHAEVIAQILASSGGTVGLRELEVWPRPGLCRANLARTDREPHQRVTPASATPQ
ncbi:helix-turn-helix domain-containing protein [Demequina sp. B12]|uniref:helix-turn-helix domain-containing protein n=1 Tax=Demequina sp. B12 TaxID=2992757 RepID=UPI00237ABC2A|nr:helix-turn-helix domain-containing protein [Demequina sp. B12]MDE0572827.1 helix-turn-helix domain-containing protein [Demequina sp. B12]